MKTLIVEDEFISRKILLRLLRRWGECDVAVDGVEAVEACRVAIDTGAAYDLICLDLGLPMLDGHEVLKQLREIEGNSGVTPGRGTKVIMTTMARDKTNIMSAFKAGCEAYLVKPVTLEKLTDQMRKLGFEPVV